MRVICIRVVNNKLDFILFYFQFLFSLLFILKLDKWCDIMLCMTQSCDTEKIIEGYRINNIIQYNNDMLVLQKVYRLQNKLVIVSIQTSLKYIRQTSF